MRPWILLQLADSALPTGGFAHSGGLEAAVQLGRVRGPDELARFLEEALWSAGSFALPFVSAACTAPAELGALDRRCDAALAGHVANRASRAQGQALARAAESAFGPPAAGVAALLRAERLPGHHAPVLGALVAALGGEEDDARRLFLFQAGRGILSAGVRMGVAGPLEAQALLARAGDAAEAVLAATRGLPVEEAASAAPVPDLLQGLQDRLYSRLFQS